jgi:precorrin-6B methylase 2
MAGSKATAEAIRTRLPMDERLEQPRQLNALLRHMGQWRSTIIGNTYVRHHGLIIYSGLFKGMEYLDHSTEGCLLPRLLGCYEQELHDDLRAFAREGLDAIVDIGCAEGYYAVGLARLMPDVTVHAYDTEARARESCKVLAQKNGVADRIVIGETFTGDMFERFTDRRTLVLIDTEGFEEQLMRPEQWPALAKLAVVMETHPDKHPDIVTTMHQRFSATHDIQVRMTALRVSDLPEWLLALPQLDQLIATWEFRATQTPWFIMRPKDWSTAA